MSYRNPASEESLEVVLKKWNNSNPNGTGYTDDESSSPDRRRQDSYRSYGDDTHDDEEATDVDDRSLDGGGRGTSGWPARDDDADAVRAKRRRRLKWCVFLFLVALAATLMGVFLPRAMRREDKLEAPGEVDSDDGRATAAPTSVRARNGRALRNLVTGLNVTLDADALEDPDAPQFAAVDRLVEESGDEAWTWDEDDNATWAVRDALLQKYVLLTLFYSSGGDDWYDNAGWDGNSSERVGVCNWYGLTCVDNNSDNDNDRARRRLQNDDDGVESTSNNATTLEGGLVANDFAAVTSINLATNNLNGPLPREICQLTSARRLVLMKNSLTGSVPGCIRRMSELTHLKINSNDLTGRLPNALYTLRNLVDLRINSNEFNGTLSVRSDQWTELRLFWAYSNAFVGTLPARIGRWTNMEELKFNNNKFAGTISAKMAKLTKLKRLDLSLNRFTGTIPTVLGQLDLLVDLYLNNNRLKGTLPTELGDLPDLERLDVQNNDFSKGSSVPDEVCDLKEKNNLFISADCKSTDVLRCDCCKRCF